MRTTLILTIAIAAVFQSATLLAQDPGGMPGMDKQEHREIMPLQPKPAASMGERTVVIASERLNDDPKDWIRVAPNHLLIISPDLGVNVELMDMLRSGRQL